MDKAKRKKIIIISIIVLVIIGIFLLIWSLSDRLGPGTPATNEQPEFIPPSANLEYKSVEPSQTSTEFNAINLAKNFAARFGSWSTDSQGYNLAELEPLSTSRMKGYLNSITIDNAEEFNGVTTKALSAEIISLGGGQARVLVGTQRIAIDKDLKETVYYQDIELWLVAAGDQWLVDRVTWQED